MFERFHLAFLYLLTNERTSHLRNTVVVCPTFFCGSHKTQPHMVCFPLVPLCPEPYLLEHWSWASVEAVPLLWEVRFPCLMHGWDVPCKLLPFCNCTNIGIWTICLFSATYTIWLKYKCVSKATFYHRDSKYFKHETSIF